MKITLTAEFDYLIESTIAARGHVGKSGETIEECLQQISEEVKKSFVKETRQQCIELSNVKIILNTTPNIHLI